MNPSEIIQDNINSLSYFLPELILTGMIVVLIIADLLLKKENSAWTSLLALGGLVITFVAVWAQRDLGSRSIFNDMLVVDPFSLYFKLLFLASTVFVVLLSIGSVELSGRPVGEYFTLMIALTLGLFLMASATNLITIFISIEFVSVTSFILATYLKTRRRSSEAGLNTHLHTHTSSLSVCVSLYVYVSQCICLSVCVS